MVAGCGAKLSKIILFVFNAIFWITGIILISTGSYLAVKSDGRFKELLGGNVDFIKHSAYALIGIGCFVFVVGFCGCCGAIKESKCLLATYIALLIIVMVAELAVGIFVGINYKTLGDKLAQNLKENYPEDRNTDEEARNSYKGLIDVIQVENSCCGIMGPEDYKQSMWNKSKKNASKAEYPFSCCMGYKLNQDYIDQDYRKCIAEKKGHTIGCYEAVKAQYAKNAPILLGIGFGIAFVEIIGLLCAFCLFCAIGVAKS